MSWPGHRDLAASLWRGAGENTPSWPMPIPIEDYWLIGDDVGALAVFLVNDAAAASTGCTPSVDAGAHFVH